MSTPLSPTLRTGLTRLVLGRTSMTTPVRPVIRASTFVAFGERESAVVATASPFYADPFGEQDSTRRAQAAVSQAAENRRRRVFPGDVHVPSGTYLCAATITIPRDVSVSGVEGETVLDFRTLTSGKALEWGPASVEGSTEQGVVTGILIWGADGSLAPPAM